MESVSIKEKVNSMTVLEEKPVDFRKEGVMTTPVNRKILT